MPEFLARHDRFDVVGSTNDVVRGWLANGTPEVCLAVADRQSAGRGRDGRTWTAPAGAALLLSLGFRPTWIAPDRAWQVAATVSLAMAEAGETIAGLPEGTIRLKWPNDLVVTTGTGVRKLAGVLGESDGLGLDDPRVVIGIGVNADWPAEAFPAELAPAMTSLREVGGRPIDHEKLLDDFLARLEAGVSALRDGRFAAEPWTHRQVTTGRDVELIAPDGGATTVRALGVDPQTGALVVGDDAEPAGRRSVLVGEIRHIRIRTADAPEKAAV